MDEVIYSVDRRALARGARLLEEQHRLNAETAPTPQLRARYAELAVDYALYADELEADDGEWSRARRDPPRRTGGEEGELRERTG